MPCGILHMTSTIHRALPHIAASSTNYNNPCSKVSHHGNFDSTVMMFCVSVPVLSEQNMTIPASSSVNANHLANITNLNVSVLPSSSLTSWTGRRCLNIKRLKHCLAGVKIDPYLLRHNLAVRSDRHAADQIPSSSVTSRSLTFMYFPE